MGGSIVAICLAYSRNEFALMCVVEITILHIRNYIAVKDFLRERFVPRNHPIINL